MADLKGPGSKVNQALTELFPVVEVENVPSELLLLMGTRLCMGRIALGPGGAGNFNTHYLHNPVGSGVLGTILEISVSTDIFQQIFMGPTQNTDTQAGIRAVADLRAFPENPTLQTMGNNNLLVAAPAFYHVVDNGTDGFRFSPTRGLAVLSPGGSFVVGCSSSNTAQRTSFFWIERTAQPSELSL